METKECIRGARLYRCKLNVGCSCWNLISEVASLPTSCEAVIIVVATKPAVHGAAYCCMKCPGSGRASCCQAAAFSNAKIMLLARCEQHAVGRRRLVRMNCTLTVLRCTVLDLDIQIDMQKSNKRLSRCSWILIRMSLSMGEIFISAISRCNAFGYSATLNGRSLSYEPSTTTSAPYILDCH